MTDILGNANIATVPSNCFVVLIRESDGTVAGTTQCVALDGSYIFPGVAAGNYAIAFIDPAGTTRGKVIHVTVP